MDSLSPITENSRIHDLKVLNEAFNYTQSNEPILLTTIDDKTKGNPTLLPILLMRLNIFEVYAIGILQSVYDEKLIKLSIGSAMKKGFSRFKNFISEQRVLYPEYCKNLESIVLKWESDDRSTHRKRNPTA